MAVGDAKQGMWQAQTFQGMWQEQTTSTAHVGTPSDTITLSDATALKATIGISETLSLSESTVEDAANVLADNANLSDALLAAVSILLGDSISLSDVIVEGSSISISDAITLSENLGGRIGSVLADIITLLDSIVSGGKAVVSDTISVADNVTGSLSYGFTTPGTADTSGNTVQGGRIGNQTWRKNVSNEPSPVTAYSKSSGNTTYTKTTVTDSSSWDLTQAEVGDVLITEDDYIGVVQSAAANVVTVDAWRKGGINLMGQAEATPVDGQTATLHKMSRARRIIMRSDPNNDADIYVGCNDPNVDATTGHPISYQISQLNSELIIEAPRDRWLNLTEIWVVTGGNQVLTITSGPMTVETGVGFATGERLNDGITLIDAISGILYPGPGAGEAVAIDSVALAETIAQAAHVALSDSITLAEALTEINGVAQRSASDSITLSDEVSGIGDGGMADGIGLVDSVSGVLISGVFPPDPPAITDCVKVGDYLYMTAQHNTFGHGILVMDVSDPANPVRETYLITQASPTGLNYPGKIILDPDGRDYLFHTRMYTLGLNSIDISTPGDPSVADTVAIAGTDNHHSDLAGYGDRLYMAVRGDGLRIIDTSDPLNLSVLAGHNFYGREWWHDIHVGGGPGDFHHIWDQPVQHSYWQQGTSYIDVNVDYIVTGTRRLWVLDRTDNPERFNLSIDCYISRPNNSGFVNSFVLDGNTAHIHVGSTSPYPDYSYMQATIGSNTASPNNCAMTAGLRRDTWYHKSQLSNGHFYNLSGTLLVHSVKIIEVGTPIEVYAFADQTRCFHVEGDYLYYPHYDSGNHHLDIYDITTPSAPVLIGTGTY
jgi:hypothetical protein